MNVVKCIECRGLYSSQTEEPIGICQECRVKASDVMEAGRAIALPEKGFDRLAEEALRMGVSIDRAAIIILCPILDDDDLYGAYLLGKRTADKPVKNGTPGCARNGKPNE